MRVYCLAANGRICRFAPLLVLFVLLIFCLSGCTASKYNQAKAKKLELALADQADDPEEADDFISQSGPKGPATPQNILKTAFSQVGRPYKYAGHKPETGFDCSGFTSWVYGQYGIKLGRSSSDQISAGKSVKQADLRPGDLVFFGRKKRITHVGIYTGDNKYIHSPTTGKRVQESNLDDRARGEYYVGARRVIDNRGASPVTDDQRQAWAPKAHRQLAFARKKGSGRAAQPVQLAASQGPTEKAAVPKARKHKVVPGDTFLALAKKYGVSSRELAQANKLDNQQIALIKPGQTLIVPPSTKVEAKPEPAEAVPRVQPASPENQLAQSEAARSKPAPQPGGATGRHKVVAGDTFLALAQKYGVASQDLARANNLNERQIALLKPGQTLIIPPKSQSTVAKAKASGGRVTRHKVASGDTIYALARKYGVSAKDLAQANNLDSKQMALLKLGQTLVVPLKSQVN